jgi:sugar/nucleoside kinase (ribokinase family)
MKHGFDRAGQIRRHPGGVAYNIAKALSNLNLSPALITSLGQDTEGDELIQSCDRDGMRTDLIYRNPHARTDVYMAIEDVNGVVAAIADAHSLEQAGSQILHPLCDGTIGSAQAPFSGLAVLDGNLTETLLHQISAMPEFSDCDLRVVPASPGKAKRLNCFLFSGNAALYVNRIEAEIICNARLPSSIDAANALIELGAARAIVTDGPDPVADALQYGETLSAAVPQVSTLAQVTGAGDVFVAAHIHAEMNGHSRADALLAGAQASADHVAGK